MPSLEAPNRVGERSITKVSSEKAAWFAVMVAALGYFVDVFDLWLFANFRIASLTDLGLSGEALTREGAFILNCQQAGLLLGGFVWGILGDKLGRMSILFGSIITYSAANIGNAFVTDVTSYAIIRFIAGVGLAGEIGAGITLVCELMPKEKRGYGVTIVATVGVAGAIAAAMVAKFIEWRHAFILGGVMGFGLLGLRYLVHESGLFSNVVAQKDVVRGSLRLLFSNRNRVLRFLGCIAIGIPIWVVFGLYAAFSPEVAASIGIGEPVIVSTTMFYSSIGITAGDLASGLLSQWWKSRRKPIALFAILGLAVILYLHSGQVTSAQTFYWILGALGFFVGFWVCALTIASEQFGTNIRSTVTTTVPNLVRATTIPISWAFISWKSSLGTAHTALTIALIGFGISLICVTLLKETFDKDLNFVEK